MQSVSVKVRIPLSLALDNVEVDPHLYMPLHQDVAVTVLRILFSTDTIQQLYYVTTRRDCDE